MEGAQAMLARPASYVFSFVAACKARYEEFDILVGLKKPEPTLWEQTVEFVHSKDMVVIGLVTLVIFYLAFCFWRQARAGRIASVHQDLVNKLTGNDLAVDAISQPSSTPGSQKEMNDVTKESVDQTDLVKSEPTGKGLSDAMGHSSSTVGSQKEVHEVAKEGVQQNLGNRLCGEGLADAMCLPTPVDQKELHDASKPASPSTPSTKESDLASKGEEVSEGGKPQEKKALCKPEQTVRKAKTKTMLGDSIQKVDATNAKLRGLSVKLDKVKDDTAEFAVLTKELRTKLEGVKTGVKKAIKTDGEQKELIGTLSDTLSGAKALTDGLDLQVKECKAKSDAKMPKATGGGGKASVRIAAELEKVRQENFRLKERNFTLEDRVRNLECQKPRKRSCERIHQLARRKTMEAESLKNQLREIETVGCVKELHKALGQGHDSDAKGSFEDLLREVGPSSYVANRHLIEILETENATIRQQIRQFAQERDVIHAMLDDALATNKTEARARREAELELTNMKRDMEAQLLKFLRALDEKERFKEERNLLRQYNEDLRRQIALERGLNDDPSGSEDGKAFSQRKNLGVPAKRNTATGRPSANSLPDEGYASPSTGRRSTSESHPLQTAPVSNRPPSSRNSAVDQTNLEEYHQAVGGESAPSLEDAPVDYDLSTPRCTLSSQTEQAIAEVLSHGERDRQTTEESKVSESNNQAHAAQEASGTDMTDSGRASNQDLI